MQMVVDGIVAPWVWTGSRYVEAPLYDPGIFGSAGSLLTGDAFRIIWNSVPVVTADLTINGVTITLGPAEGFYAPYASVDVHYQNITVATFSPLDNLAGNISLNSFDHAGNPYAPHGLGGAFHLICCPTNGVAGNYSLNGYFYVTSMIDLADLAPVPGSVPGEGLAALLVVGLLLSRFGGSWFRRSANGSATGSILC